MNCSVRVQSPVPAAVKNEEKANLRIRIWGSEVRILSGAPAFIHQGLGQGRVRHRQRRMDPLGQRRRISNADGGHAEIMRAWLMILFPKEMR